MATDKRARQRANREAKQAEMQKAQRRQAMVGRAKRIGVWAIIGIVLFILANIVFGSSGDDAEAMAHLMLALSV